jgi:ribosomal protein S18 acetylase RimI-like enzyme
MHEMNIEIRFGTAGLDWRAVCEIFKRAPLGSREPDKLRRASENSHIVCSAWDGETIVGIGRAISDRQYQSIYDVVVLPEYQNKGVGRSIMNALLQSLPKGTNVLIFVVPRKEGFYRKLGFGDLKTGMGLFANPEKARVGGYLE